MTTFRCDAPQKPRRRRPIVLRSLGAVALLLVLLVAMRIGIVRSFDNGPLPPTLTELRTLPVTMPGGERAAFGELFRPGIPTVVSLWASWCGPCRSEAPKLVELRRKFGRDELNLVYLNVREDGTPARDLKDFLVSVGMSPTDYAVMDQKQLRRLTNDTQNLIPRTYVFDNAGAPEAMIVGYKPLALARIAGLVDR